MKKKRFLSFKKRAKDTLKKWSVSSFFQQLTVVVLGIFITFSGNSFFQERSTQRKLKATLVLVKKELLSNQNMLQEILRSFKHEQAFASELNKNKNDLTQIDSSYLVNNQSVFFHLDARSLETDALEVLKTSSLIQDFKDQTLCFELLSTYSSIEKALRVYHFFMDLKRSRNQKLFDDQVFTAKMKAFSEKPHSVHEYFSFLLAEPLFEALYTTSIQSISDDAIVDAIEAIDRVVENLDRGGARR